MRIISGTGALLLLCAASGAAGSAGSKAAQAANPLGENGQAAISPKWGFFSKLAGASFQNPETGTVNTFYWSEPNKTLEYEGITSSGLTTGRFVLDQRGQIFLTQQGEFVGVEAQADGTFIVPRSPQLRTRYSFDGRFLITTEKLDTGRWTAGQTSALRRLQHDEIAAAKQQIINRQIAAAKASGDKLPQALAYFRSLKGSWSNGQRMWTFKEDGNRVLMEQRNDRGKQVLQGAIEIRETKKGRELKYVGYTMVPISGGYYLPGFEYAILASNDREFLVKAAKLKGGDLKIKPAQDKPFLGSYRLLDERQARNWIDRAHARRESGGDSGLLGALAMGMGAAMAGGNAEQVMGMAMKGAELTTDNEMSRNVLAGQGDVMIAEGTQRMIDENARSNSGNDAPASSSSIPRSASSSAANGNPATSSATRTRYTFCIEHRRAAGEEGRRKEVVFYSRVGPITRRTDEYFRDTAGFSDFVDTQTNLPRSPVSANCPQFDTQAAAEADLAMKRGSERPDVRPFVYVRDYIPE